MKEDFLKLTAYFGERDRREGRLLADELLDLYERHQLRTSVLVRGIEGFGTARRGHTDRLLTLSEDLPAIAIAVDERRRIEAVLPAVLERGQRGLLTLERARLLTGAAGELQLPEELQEATKLTVYVGRQERVARTPAFVAICELLHHAGVSGATVLLGVDGTSHGRRTRARFFARNAEVPMMIIAVGPGAEIACAVPEISKMAPRSILTLERLRVCKRDGELLSMPQTLPATDQHGLAVWQKLMLYGSESARHEGRSVHQTLMRRLRSSGVAGATSLRGIWGFHGDHAPHGDKLLQLRRHVPVVTIVVDTPERIAAAFEIVDELTSESGLVTCEMVPAVSAFSETDPRSGLRLARHEF